MIPAISGAVGPLGPGEWSIPAIGSLGPQASTAADAGAAGGSSFSGVLTGAINSLEQSQTSAATAAQQLATGQATDPTQAIVAVENASLEMDLASELRTKLVDAASNLFQTQIS